MSALNKCNRCFNLIEACTCRPAQEWFDQLTGELKRTIVHQKEIEKQPTVLDLIADIATLVETTPNDMELGAAVRKLFT